MCCAGPWGGGRRRGGGGGHVHPLQSSASGSVLCGIKVICEVFILFFNYSRFLLLLIKTFFFFFFFYLFFFLSSFFLSFFFFFFNDSSSRRPISSVSCSLLTGTAGTENNVVSAKIKRIKTN